MTALAEKKEKALVTYVTAGDPSLAETPALLAEIARAGADVIELGVPWSRSVGRRRRSSSARWSARSRRAAPPAHTVGKTLDAVRAFRRESDVPVVLFGYYNPLLQRGPCARGQRGARRRRRRRARGRPAARGVGRARRPSSRAPACLPRAAPGADDVAGARARHRRARVGLRLLRRAHRRHRRPARSTSPTSARRAAELRPSLGALPFAVGFGVRDPASARALAPHCDAVVVGTALVQAIAEAPGRGRAPQGRLRARARAQGRAAVARRLRAAAQGFLAGRAPILA